MVAVAVEVAVETTNHRKKMNSTMFKKAARILIGAILGTLAIFGIAIVILMFSMFGGKDEPKVLRKERLTMQYKNPNTGEWWHCCKADIYHLDNGVVKVQSKGQGTNTWAEIQVVAAIDPSTGLGGYQSNYTGYSKDGLHKPGDLAGSGKVLEWKSSPLGGYDAIMHDTGCGKRITVRFSKL